MRTTYALLCGGSLVAAALTPAVAYFPKPNELCGATEHNVKHEIKSGPNKGTYLCDATTCVETSNGTPTGVKATHYDNCVAALTRPPQTFRAPVGNILETSPGFEQQPSPTGRPVVPKAPAGAIIR